MLQQLLTEILQQLFLRMMPTAVAPVAVYLDTRMQNKAVFEMAAFMSLSITLPSALLPHVLPSLSVSIIFTPIWGFCF